MLITQIKQKPMYKTTTTTGAGTREMILLLKLNRQKKYVVLSLCITQFKIEIYL